MPDSIAAAAVTSLNVDPGGSVVPIARLISGSRGSALSSLLRSATAPKSCEASLFGSKVGVEAIASTRPVVGSSATTAPCASPGRASRPSQAASCAAALAASWTLPPLGSLLLSMSTRRVTNSRESSPASTEFWELSTPVWPYQEK